MWKIKADYKTYWSKIYFKKYTYGFRMESTKVCTSNVNSGYLQAEVWVIFSLSIIFCSFQNSCYQNFYICSQRVTFDFMQSKPVSALATAAQTQWLHPVLNYFQRLFPGPWWPVGKWSPHSCYLISSHCWLTHYWSVNGILFWGFLCSSTCCINHPVTLLIFLHFLSPDFSQQPCFSFHKSPPTRIAIRLHQQACHGDCLPNNSWMLQTLLNSIFHYEHFWPRERRLLSSPSIYYFERFFSIICGLLRVLLISLISSLTNISILRE